MPSALNDPERAALNDLEQQWITWDGTIVTAPYSDEPTGFNWYTGYTHRLMRPQPGQVVPGGHLVRAARA